MARRGQLKLGHVEGGTLALHFEADDGERFAITNAVRVYAEEMGPPSWATFLRGTELREARGWRINIEAQQLTESRHDAAVDYDYEGEAEELPDLPHVLDPPPVRLLEASTEKPPCGG